MLIEICAYGILVWAFAQGVYHLFLLGRAVIQAAAALLKTLFFLGWVLLGMYLIF